jgi:alkylation response protein AidB-like acyl-CoA dehydrogenase
MHGTGTLIEAVRELAPQIATAAEQAERERRLPESLIAAMAKARLFAMCVPRNLGGSETHPVEILGVLEAIAKVDASTAWVTMIAATGGISSAYLARDIAQEVFGDGAWLTAGVVAPSGKAIPVEGGRRVSGRWAFASGCEHSRWMALNSIVEGSDPPQTYFALIPTQKLEIIDTWDVVGLRATGSHDIAAQDVFVPEGYGYDFGGARPLQSGPLYSLSIVGFLAVAVASVALGIGRGALDDLRELATAKMPVGRAKPLAELSHAQSGFAEAEASLRAGRAFLVEAIETLWDIAERGERASKEQRALVRLAATHAAMSAIRATDIAYGLAGGTAIYSKSTFQRRFRDIHALSAHFMVGPGSLEAAGRALFGLDVPGRFL